MEHKQPHTFRSIEHFHHFRCTHCNGWWGIGDAPNERQNWFCPWCGKENLYTEMIDVGTASKAPWQGGTVKTMDVKLGIYEHYKGNRYRVLGVAKHSETLEDMVVYQALYGDESIWVRPLEMFCEDVVVEGKRVPRFSALET